MVGNKILIGVLTYAEIKFFEFPWIFSCSSISGSDEIIIRVQVELSYGSVNSAPTSNKPLSL